MRIFNYLATFICFITYQPVLGTNVTVDIQEWQVPWEKTRPRDPYVAPDGRVWFCGQAGAYLAVLDTATGNFEKFDLGKGAGPHNLIIDAEGFVWYAGNLRSHIGKLDPVTGNIEKFAMPDENVTDPHTLVFNSKGDIWFTTQFGNHIGKLFTKTGEIRLIPVPTKGARPYGIVVDNNDRPWIALFGTHKLASIDPDTLEFAEHVLPRNTARPRRLDITSDNTVWYVDYADGFLGRFNPKTQEIREWPLPGGENSRPYGMAIDDKDHIWLVETGLEPNRLVGFEPGSETFFSKTDVHSGGGTIRHMYYHNITGEVWFGTDTNTIGRVQIP